MIWLIFVGIFVAIFVIGVYWMRSLPHGSGHHDPKALEIQHRLLEQKRTEAEISCRHADQQRRYGSWRRR